MAGFPADLPWRDFARVLKLLDYELFKEGPGSARTYRNLHRDPEFVTFHEPHGKRGIPTGTLREYVKHLKLGRDEFLAMLNS
jgi:hypothetical protein